jgi:putative hydrolase of the HAD superfamily
MHIAFDADDTLWHNESVFSLTQKRVTELLIQHMQPGPDGDARHATLEARLLETERRNLGLFGYGVKGFTLSMIETALDVSQGAVPASVIRQILEAGKAMLEHPVELLPGVEDTVKALAGRHPLMLITKGDLFDQESKLARSGLSELFSIVEIVSEKDPATYQRVLRRHDIAPERFVMVGNSVKSDILPVVAIGGNAVHVPYHTTWALEVVTHKGAAEEGFWEIQAMSQLPEVLDRIAAQGWGAGAQR